MRRFLAGVAVLSVLVAPLQVGSSAVAGGGGFREGPNIRISGGSAVGYEGDPVVVYASDPGHSLVVWVDGRRGSSLWAQRISAEGQRLTAELRRAGVLGHEA